MHYPEVKELEDIIITDLQLIFDHITQVIVCTFTFEATRNVAKSNDCCNTGQFLESHIQTLSNREQDPQTPVRPISLLRHPHIISGPMELNVVIKVISITSCLIVL